MSERKRTDNAEVEHKVKTILARDYGLDSRTAVRAAKTLYMEGLLNDGKRINTELRELITRWRVEASHMRWHSDKYMDPELTKKSAGAIEDLANELEELLEE